MMKNDPPHDHLDAQAKHALFMRLCEHGDGVWQAVRGSPDDLRARGLTVAIHNDYRLNGESMTFWIMVFKTRHMEAAIAFKGEGTTDQEALDQIRAEFANLTDDWHHAPLCPANHYHGKRAPTGPCSCGATDGGRKMTYRPAGFIDLSLENRG